MRFVEVFADYYYCPLLNFIKKFYRYESCPLIFDKLNMTARCLLSLVEDFWKQ